MKFMVEYKLKSRTQRAVEANTGVTVMFSQEYWVQAIVQGREEIGFSPTLDRIPELNDIVKLKNAAREDLIKRIKINVESESFEKKVNAILAPEEIEI